MKIILILSFISFGIFAQSITPLTPKGDHSSHSNNSCYDKPSLDHRKKSYNKSKKILLSAKTIFSCLNVYSSLGDLVLKAGSDCHSVSWYINEGNNFREFNLNNQNEIDRNIYHYNRPDKKKGQYGVTPRVLFDLSDPPPFIGALDLSVVKCITKKVPENKIIDFFSYEEVIRKSWDEMDFSTSGLGMSGALHAYIDGVLYLDNMDSGNFLWGYSAAKLGISLPVALSGAHLNSRFKDDMKEWDSEADQNAIKNGHSYFIKNMSRGQKVREFIDYLIW